MDAAEVAAKVCALEAELAATSPRIADLEARVSFLEAENARWRKAMPDGEVFRRLEEGLGGSKRKAAQAVGVPGLAYGSFDEVGDGEEEGVAADAGNGRSGEEHGVLAVPTPRKRSVRAVTGGSNDDNEIDDAGGGGGGDRRRVRNGGIVGLEDDDVSVTPCGKKHATARVVSSDSEDAGEKNAKDAELQVGVLGVPPSRKRALRRIFDSDEEDDEDDRMCLDETEGRSTPTVRRSTRLAEKQSKKARVEPNDHEESEDGSGQDGDMCESKNDADCSEDSDSEQMDYTLLKDVTLESNNRVRVRVRITRISHYMNKYQRTGTLQLDFVMLDEQGGMMDGQVPAWFASLFLQRIKEDDVYYIHHFKVVHPSLPYRAVDHPCMAMFTEYTEISKDEHVPDSFPVYAYKISPYEVLRSRENNTALMSDAIGIMLEISNVKTVTVNGASRAVRNVYISDGRETAVVALWEAHANQFPAEILQQQMQQGPVVILFVAVTVKLREGQLCLQGSKVCRWYPNAPIPEVLALQNSCAGVSHEARLVDTSPTQTQTVRVSVGDIWDLNPHETLGNAYDVDIAIKSLVPGESWWYLGCKGCKKTIFQSGDGYRCSKCGGTVEEIRYRLALLGLDPLCLHDEEPKAAEFVFYGDIGAQLTGASARTLIATGQGGTDYIPHEITRLYGRHYNLKVNVSRGSLQRARISFQVYSMRALPTPSTMPLSEKNNSTSTPSTSVETRDNCGSRAVPEKEKDSLKHVDIGNTSKQASPAMHAAGACC